MLEERERRSSARRSVKHRAARASLVLLCAVLCAGLAAAWFTLREPNTAGSAGPETRVENVPAAVPLPRDPRPERSVDRVAPAAEDPRRFDGRGRIDGVLEARGVDLPERWALVLEPDPLLVGSGRAEARRVAFERGETRFEVDDLPFGGYRVYAEAESANGARVPVLLTRGASRATVTLRLGPTGFVDGIVLDHAGRPAEGLAVHVEHQASRVRLSTRVDAAGLFVVRDVRDGEYEIRLGEFDAPLVPRGSFSFRAPSLRWRDTQLPPTGSARILVRDGRGDPIADVEVVGTSPPSGLLSGRTSVDGTVDARFVLPGRYSIEARADGRVGRAHVEVVLDTRAEAAIVIE